MNKKIIVLIICLFSFMCVGCNDDNGKDQTLKIIFITNSQESKSDLIVSKGNLSKISMPTLESVEKKFDGWYIDEDCTTLYSQEYLENKFKEYDKLSEKEVILYAKWSEKIVDENKDFILNIIGKIDDKIAVNSKFQWNNPHSDSSFKVSLYDEYGNEVYNNTLNNPMFELDFVLEYGTKYKLKINGTDSNEQGIFEFQTIGSKDDKYLNVVAAQLTVFEPFIEHMVIQRNKVSYVRGLTAPNIVVKVQLLNDVFYGISNEDGSYEVAICPKEVIKTGTNLTISIMENKKYYIKDVLVGDVYLVAGQSNIQWCLKDSDYEKTDVDNAINNGVRYFSQSTQTSDEESVKTLKGKWFIPSVIDTGYTYYSAIAFMVGSMLSEEVKDVPIGIICACQGDTNIVNWMSKEYYDGKIATKNGHYNGMIYPLRNTNLSGVIWYQGCNNSAKGIEYKDLLLKLFTNYRELFNNEDMNFYVVQLPVYDGDSGNNYDFSYVREAQLKACESDENAYIIATCDGGDPSFIHPREKRYICERLVKSILSTVYDKDYLPQGPTFKEFTVENEKAIVTVNNGDGLNSDGEIVGFEVAGVEGKYYKATAVIENGKIILSSSKVSKVVNIRYGFSKSPFLNVFNKDGYLMSPFRTDNYNLGIDLLNYEDTDVYHDHQDGSEMKKEIVQIGNDYGLKITKTNDGKTYGSAILDKWGAIGYEASGFKLRVIGNNSNSRILFRIVEGSYEIWAYSFIDNFEGEKEFIIPLSDFVCVYNKKDNILDLQGVMNLEITIENKKESSITILDSKFIEMEKTKPLGFIINNVEVNDEYIKVDYAKSLFAESYEILISQDGVNYANPLFKYTTSDLGAKYLLTGSEDQSKPYFVKVIAINELGTTEARNSGYVLYFENEDVCIINNFDFTSQESLQAYLDSNMKVNAGLNVTLCNNGIKIESTGAGWQNFIFVIEKGLNKGFSKLRFTADLSEYKGEVVMELVDQGYGIFNKKLEFNKTDGLKVYEINLTDFIHKTSKTPFDGRDLIWVSFNFNDSIGGTILFDDVQFIK